MNFKKTVVVLALLLTVLSPMEAVTCYASGISVKHSDFAWREPINSDLSDNWGGITICLPDIPAYRQGEEDVVYNFFSENRSVEYQVVIPDIDQELPGDVRETILSRGYSAIRTCVSSGDDTREDLWIYDTNIPNSLSINQVTGNSLPCWRMERCIMRVSSRGDRTFVHDYRYFRRADSEDKKLEMMRACIPTWDAYLESLGNEKAWYNQIGYFSQDYSYFDLESFVTSKGVSCDVKLIEEFDEYDPTHLLYYIEEFTIKPAGKSSIGIASSLAEGMDETKVISIYPELGDEFRAEDQIAFCQKDLSKKVKIGKYTYIDRSFLKNIILYLLG